jgi:hypothetical protein
MFENREYSCAKWWPVRMDELMMRSGKISLKWAVSHKRKSVDAANKMIAT